MAALLLDAGVLHIQCPAACRAKGSLPSSSSSSPSCSSQASPAALLANMERNKRNGGALVMLMSGGGANSESLRWSSARLCVPLRGSTVRVPRSTVAENATPVCMLPHFFSFFSFVGFCVFCMLGSNDTYGILGFLNFTIFCKLEWGNLVVE